MFAKRFSDLKPYVPGEQPRDRVYVKLNANENPYPPSPEVSRVLSGFDPNLLRLYPDPDATELREAIASMVGHGVTPAMVFAGNGSDEVLSFVFYAFFDSDRPLRFPEHTYSFYPVYAGYYGIPFERVPLAPDWSVDVHALAQGESSGIILANPNAPTGVFLPVAKIRELLASCPRSRVVVVDEAYIDFGGETAIPLLEEFENLVIVRTFSKSYCFAGARLGFVIANPRLIDALFTTKNSFNHFPIDALTQRIGVATCRDDAYYRLINARICATRDRFAAGLRAAGYEVLPSLTNFVFARKVGFTGPELYRRARDAGYLIRHFDHPGIRDFVRISVGTDNDMDGLLAVLASIDTEGSGK